MAFYYVKSGGTATGDAGRAASARTGTFAAMGASAYYDNIDDATTVPTTGIVSGDSIYVSDIHSHSYVVSVNLTGPTGAPVFLVSVSDTNADQYSIGAFEDTTVSAGNDFYFDNSWSIHGCEFSTQDNVGNFIIDSTSNYVDCEFTLTGSSDRFYANSGEGFSNLVNCTINLDHADAQIFIAGNHKFQMIGGTVATITGGTNGLVAASGGFGSLFQGVDLDAVTGYLVVEHGAVVTDPGFFIRFDKCRLNSSITGFIEEPLSRPGFCVLVTNCSNSSDTAEYQYYFQDFFGIVQDQDSTGIHRDESTAFSGGEKVSLNATTSANSNTLSPLVFDAPARFAALSSASTDTVRIYFASTATLTDNDVWAELIYPDGTNKQIFNRLSNQNSDPLATGTTHTTDSGSTWKDGGSDLAGYNEYIMDLDTSGDVGADGVPIIRIYIGIASTTIYFDTTVDVVA